VSIDDEAKSKAVQKVLGEPFYGEVIPEVAKTRFRLLTVSFVSIVIVSADLRIGTGSTVLGLNIANLSDAVVRYSLLVTVAYLLAHFFWAAWDSFVEWRLRLTGTRVVYVTGAKLGSEDGDYPDDPRQSTLYSWWLQKCVAINSVSRAMTDLQKSREAWLDDFNRLKADPSYRPEIHGELGGKLEEIRVAIASLDRSFAQTEAVLSRSRIPVSLGRFDAWFRLLCRSQSIRWLVFDLLTPLAVGIVALGLLSTDAGLWIKSMLNCFK
jgi:hypothetical protein